MNAAGERLCYDIAGIEDRVPRALSVQIGVSPGSGDDNPLAREIDAAVWLGQRRTVDAQRESALRSRHGPGPGSRPRWQ